MKKKKTRNIYRHNSISEMYPGMSTETFTCMFYLRGRTVQIFKGGMFPKDPITKRNCFPWRENSTTSFPYSRPWVAMLCSFTKGRYLRSFMISVAQVPTPTFLCSCSPCPWAFPSETHSWFGCPPPLPADKTAHFPDLHDKWKRKEAALCGMGQAATTHILLNNKRSTYHPKDANWKNFVHVTLQQLN